MMLDVCLLGCGGVMPLADRWLTSLLVRHNGHMVLIDCGEGTQIPLKQAGWGFKAIEALCLTHYHADHTAGLPGFLLTLGNSGREEPLTIMGPPGLSAVIGGVSAMAPNLPFDIHLVELPEGKQKAMTIGDMDVSCTDADHTLPCLSYSIEIRRAGRFDPVKAEKNKVPKQIWSKLQKGLTLEVEGKAYTPEMVLGEPRRGLKISYATDTRPTESLAGFIQESDLFICEGMYGDEDKLPKAIDKKHMLFREAAELAVNGHVKELWLTHFSPAMENPEQYLGNTRAIFPDTHLGSNLMYKSLNFRD